MSRIDARLFVGPRGADLAASTAYLALVHKMGFGDRLVGLKRYDFFHLVIESEATAESFFCAPRTLIAARQTCKIIRA